MRYTYEYKRKCVELYREGKWTETPEGVSDKSFRDKVRLSGKSCVSVAIEAGIQDRLMSLQLTSGSGEQTFSEVALRLNRRTQNLTLLSYSYCITGTSKPADT